MYRFTRALKPRKTRFCHIKTKQEITLDDLNNRITLLQEDLHKRDIEVKGHFNQCITGLWVNYLWTGITIIVVVLCLFKLSDIQMESKRSLNRIESKFYPIKTNIVRMYNNE